MNTFDEIEEPVVLSLDGRKHGRTPENHKRAKGKQMCQSGGGKIPAILCTYDTVVNVCKLTHEDIWLFSETMAWYTPTVRTGKHSITMK